MRYALSALTGFVCNWLLILSAQFLAAVGAPSGYFQRFEPQHRELALGLLNAATFAVPQFLLAFAASYGAAKLLRFQRSKDYVCFLAGAVFCFVLLVLGHRETMLEQFLPRELWQLFSGPSAGWLGLLLGPWLQNKGAGRLGAR